MPDHDALERAALERANRAIAAAHAGEATPSPTKSDGQLFLDRLAALRDLVEANAIIAEQIAASATGQAPPKREQRIKHPFAKPIEGFTLAADAALAQAERDAVATSDALKPLQAWFLGSIK